MGDITGTGRDGLRETRNTGIAAGFRMMKTAESRMAPVWSAFKDQVLFLKHHLNARAISSLQKNAEQIQSDVAVLVREMEASIREATDFIEQMQALK